VCATGALPTRPAKSHRVGEHDDVFAPHAAEVRWQKHFESFVAAGNGVEACSSTAARQRLGVHLVRVMEGGVCLCLVVEFTLPRPHSYVEPVRWIEVCCVASRALRASHAAQTHRDGTLHAGLR
jgi:hypothetical protein